jgi:hypothetical protein
MRANKRHLWLLRHQRFELGVAVTHDVLELAAECRRLFKLTCEAHIADRMIDLRSLSDDAQFLGAQQRHRGDGDCACFHHSKPARDQHGIVGPVQEHSIARHDAQMVHEHVGDAVRAFQQLRVGPVLFIRVQRGTLAVTFGDGVVDQHDAAIDAVRISQLG